MKTTRRELLIAGGTGVLSVGTAAAIATAVTPSVPTFSEHHTPTSKPFVFSPSSVVRNRKSFWDLSDDEVRTLCKAVAYARNQYLVNDPRKWENYAKIHAWHCTGEAGADPHGVLQVHWSWHFLPWHRGYIYFLERILAQALKDQGIDDSTFAYPYWDWTAHQEMPNSKERVARGLASPLWGYDLTQENMVNTDTLGFDNLALFDGNRGPSLAKSKMTPDNEVTPDSKSHIEEAQHYLSAEYIKLALTLPWEQFGGKVDINRTSQGILEAGPHNDGHDWCGTRFGSNRDMGTLKFAAQDPIFFMHHGNIDRIFSLYRGEMPDVNGPWGQQTYDYTDADGSTVTVSVKEIMTVLTPQVHYVAPSDDKLPQLLAASRPRKERAVVSMPFSNITVLPSVPTTVAVSMKEPLPTDLANDVVLLEVETGPIRRRGRATIRLYVDRQYVGRIKMLDGDQPATQDANTTHTFVVTANKLGTLMGFVGDPNQFSVRFEASGLEAPVQIKRVSLRLLQ